METILYYINVNKNMLLSFLAFIVIIGILLFLLTMKKSTPKQKAMFYGLFMQMKLTDILNISIITSETFLIVYELFETSEMCMYINFSIMIILAVIYTILNFKRILYLVVILATEIGIDYFIYIYSAYLIEVENTNILLIALRVLMIICMIFFSIALYFREIVCISKKSKSKQFRSTSLVVKK